MAVTADEIWSVEWDPTHKVAHIQLLRETVIENIRRIRNFDERPFLPGYLLVGIAASAEEANELVTRLEEEFDHPLLYDDRQVNDE